MDKRDPNNYRAAVDILIADRMGIGVVEGLHWHHTGTEARYTEAIRRLQGRREPSHPTPQSPNYRTKTEKHRQHSFRKMGRRTRYQVHQQFNDWTAGRRNDADLHQSFVRGLGDTIPGSTPR